MKTRQIHDENSLIEVYIHWFIDGRDFEIDKLGHISDNEDLGIYLIWNKHNQKFCILTTDWSYYTDKRIKKPLTRYKKSTTFFYPMEEEWDSLGEGIIEEVLVFLGGGYDSKIIFDQTQDMAFIQNLLKSS